METPRIRIIHGPDADNPFTVLYKPVGLPSAPLAAGDESALVQAMRLFPQIKAVRGKKDIEHGLVHRLDTATHGILLVACTQSCYDSLRRSQDEGLFIKTYVAECDRRVPAAESGFPPPPALPQTFPARLTVRSAFRAYGKGAREVRPVTERSGRMGMRKATSVTYETQIALSSGEGTYRAECRLSRGFRHQVRCHLAWIGYPVIGDSLYNPGFPGDMSAGLRFTATAISFPHPQTGKVVTFSL